MPQQHISFDSMGLSLQAVLEYPESEHKVPGVVICHPSPRFGGDMASSVVVGISKRLNAAGIATLRFNFRGVGTSEGAHDKGDGEVDDALAALTALDNRPRALSATLGEKRVALYKMLVMKPPRS